jgi:FMN phosphatase YigB (HAD superfamily)
MQPKVIFVDWDGTLSRSKFWENCPANILHPALIDQITTFLFRDSQDLVQHWMKGSMSRTAVTNILAAQFHVDPQILYRELERSCRAMQFVDESLVGKIGQIRKQGTRVVIATDNMDTFNHWTVPALGLQHIFDGILNSADRSAFKKERMADGHSAFFHHYLSQQHAQAHETVLLDDSPRNAVVEMFGMQFVHITRTRPISQALDAFIYT